jgi:hypothetical protein
MKTMVTGFLMAGLLLGMLSPAGAEDVVLFSAAASGADAWVWEGAKLTSQDGKLVLARAAGDVGDVYLQDRFAYIPEATLDVNVDSVIAGTYSVQVLAFKGATYLGALDLLKDTSQIGLKTYQLGKMALPAGTETITFKLWVSKTIGSATVLDDLKYYVQVDPALVAFDKVIDAATVATAEQVDWMPGDGGGVMTLQTNATMGSIVLSDQIARPLKGTLILDVADVKNGTLTAQLCAFDGSGGYLDSVDVIKKATAGMSIPLGPVAWPDGTSTFQVKVWIGGSAGASATIKRVLVLK